MFVQQGDAVITDHSKSSPSPLAEGQTGKQLGQSVKGTRFKQLLHVWLGSLVRFSLVVNAITFLSLAARAQTASVTLTGDSTSCSSSLGSSEQGTISPSFCDVTVTNNTGSSFNFNTYYLSPAQGTNFAAPPVYSASVNYAVPLADVFIVYYSASANCATAHNCQAYQLAQANGPGSTVITPGTNSSYWVGPLNALDAQPVTIMNEGDAASPTWGTDSQTCGVYPGGQGSDAVFVGGTINATLDIPQPIQHSIANGATCHIHAYMLPTQPGTRTGNLRIVDKYGNLLSTVALTSTGVAPNDKHNPTRPADFNTDWPTSWASYRQKTVCASSCDFTTLSAALTDASTNCGTTGTMISIAPSVVTTGLITWPVNNCVDPAYVIVKSSDIGSSGDGTHLPIQHNRVGNVNTLPDTTHMPQFSTASSLVSTCATGANHYRIAGIEYTHTGPLTIGSYLALSNVCSDHIIYDRIYAHTTDINDSNPVDISCNYCAVLDSYAWSPSTNEIQAISLAGPVGPIKVKNNFIVAAGENFMTGGGGEGIGNPHDIQVLGNHMFKPLTWNPFCTGVSNPCPGGVTWDGLTRTVKNLLEFKEGQIVLVSGNVLENNWGGFGQDGTAVLITEGTNQAGGHPDSQSSDVTMEYNIIRHVGNGFNQIGANTFWIASASAHVKIDNNLWYDIGSSSMESCTTCSTMAPSLTGLALHGYPTISYWTTNGDYTKDVDFLHNTVLDTPGSMLEYDNTQQRADSVNFQYNLVAEGNYGIVVSTDLCGAMNIAQMMNCIWASNTFNNNGVIGTSLTGYPTGLIFTASNSTVGFSNYSAGESGTISGFALASSSSFHAGNANQALDNTDMGANITTLMSQTSCAISGQCAGAAPTSSPVRKGIFALDKEPSVKISGDELQFQF